MTLCIKIRSANLTHDTELIGQMDVYIVVFTKQGVELKRTGIQQGKNPVWEAESFMCSQELGGLQFRLYDKERIKQDDFIGRAKWSFQSIIKRPYEGLRVAVPLQYHGKNAGNLNLEVYYDEGRMHVGGPSNLKQIGVANNSNYKSTQLGYFNYNNFSYPSNQQQNMSPMQNISNFQPGQSNVSTQSAHFNNSQVNQKNQLPPRPPSASYMQQQQAAQSSFQNPLNSLATSQVLPAEHQANRPILNSNPLTRPPQLNSNVNSQASESSQPLKNQTQQIVNSPNIPPGMKPHPALNFLYSSVASKVSESGRIQLQKVEHTPSYNLFTMFDDCAPTAQFSFIPDKLRNN